MASGTKAAARSPQAPVSVVFNSTATDETITSDGAVFNDVFLNDGLVGYWKFDEKTATPNEAGAIDSSGYGNTGTWKGDPTPDGNTAGLNFVNERSLDFDGAGDYVEIANFLGKPTVFTVAHWIKLSATQNTRTIFSSYDGNGDGWVTGIKDGDNNVIKFFLGDATNLFSTYALANNIWYHVVVTYDNGSPKLYINGILNNSSADTITYDGDGIGNNDIGHLAPNDAQHFNGFIDDVCVYNRALSAGEITLLAQGGQPGTATAEYLLADALDVNGDLIIAGGTLDTGGKNIAVAGSFYNYGGVFEHDNAGSVTLDGTGTGSEIQGGSNYTFFNLVVNNSAGTWSALNDIYVDNSILISAGELDVHASIDAVQFDGTLAVGTTGTFTGGSTKLITHNGDLETTTSATYTATSGFTRITADTDLAASTFTAGSGTVIFSASDTDNTLLSNGEQFNDVFLGDGLVGYWAFNETAEGNV